MIVEVRYSGAHKHDYFALIENVHEDYTGTVVIDIG